MNETVFNIILTLIPILGTIITGVIIPFFVSKIGTERLNEIIKWTGRTVKAAEKLFPESGSGEQKKEYVINFIDKLFNKKKTVITKEQIEVLLEAAVEELR